MTGGRCNAVTAVRHFLVSSATVSFSSQETKACATDMGVLTLQLLVCGQLILFSLAAENATYPHQINESPSNTTNTSQVNPPATAVSLNTTGNYTENNSTSVSNSTNHPNNTNLTNSTTQTPSARPQSTSSAPKQSNATVSGSTIKPNSTTAHVNQTRTSAPKTTVSTSSTSATSRYNTTHSSTTVYTTTKTSPVTKPTEKPSTTVTQNNSTDFIKSSVGLNSSEKSLTVLFSALLGVIVVIILVYFAHKYRKRKQARVQYTHRRLQNEDTGEPFAAPEDTLVISGGLYDGPQIYNPTMTVQNEEDFQTDASGFGYTPTQFRLEFLKEDQQRARDRETATFQTFHANDQEP